MMSISLSQFSYTHIHTYTLVRKHRYQLANSLHLLFVSFFPSNQRRNLQSGIWQYLPKPAHLIIIIIILLRNNNYNKKSFRTLGSRMLRRGAKELSSERNFNVPLDVPTVRKNYLLLYFKQYLHRY